MGLNAIGNEIPHLILKMGPFFDLIPPTSNKTLLDVNALGWAVGGGKLCVEIILTHRLAHILSLLLVIVLQDK